MIPRTHPECQIELVDATPASDWQSILASADITAEQLRQKLGIAEHDWQKLAAAGPELATLQKAFPLRVPEPYLQRMRRGDCNDPLLLQVLPQTRELDSSEGFVADPLCESEFVPVTGLVHKYQRRALLIVTQACAIHCRYCFRRHFPYGEQRASRAQWQQSFDYFRSDPSIDEVIFSGGDPLACNDSHLSWLAGELAAIGSIRRLRIHSRWPVVIPQRVNDQLLAWLGRWPGQKVVVIHCNHAREIDTQVQAAISRLTESGATVLNQSVLLAGINDNAEALVELSEALFAAGAMPYYLHAPDKVAGTQHFFIDDHYSKGLLEEVRANLPGYLVPRLVREEPYRSAKTPLTG